MQPVVDGRHQLTMRRQILKHLHWKSDCLNHWQSLWNIAYNYPEYWKNQGELWKRGDTLQNQNLDLFLTPFRLNVLIIRMGITAQYCYRHCTGPLEIMKINMCCHVGGTQKGKIRIPGIWELLLQMELEHHWVIYPRYLSATLCKLNETLSKLWLKAY